MTNYTKMRTLKILKYFKANFIPFGDTKLSPGVYTWESGVLLDISYWNCPFLLGFFLILHLLGLRSAAFKLKYIIGVVCNC